MDQFRDGERGAVVEVDPSELNALLHRLHFVDDGELELPKVKITVDDVAEAMDVSPVWVIQELMALRDERLRNQVGELLTEWELPLHRVERPDTNVTKDGLATHFRERTIESVLDKLHSDHYRRAQRKRSARALDKALARQTTFVLFTLMAVLGLVLAIGLSRTLFRGP